MPYRVRAWDDEKGTATFIADAETKRDALEKAKGLRDQGFDHVAVAVDARELSLAAFARECAEDEE